MGDLPPLNAPVRPSRDFTLRAWWDMSPSSPSYAWYCPALMEALTTINKLDQAPSVKSLDDVMITDTGKERDILAKLGIPHVEFSADEVNAFKTMTRRQHRTFGVDAYNLFVGNLGEAALQDLLIDGNKAFSARSFLIYNMPGEQEEMDAQVQFKDGAMRTVGAKTKVERDSTYLYPKKRLATMAKVADYVVFFQHVRHRLLFATGVVEREFLRRDPASTVIGINAAYEWPEAISLDEECGMKAALLRCGQTTLAYKDADSLPQQEFRQRAMDYFRKRMSWAMWAAKVAEKG
jgi:hypothetical protein